MGTSSHPPSGLPHGWRALRLGEIARVYPGGRLGLTKTDDYVESGVPAFSAAGQDGNVAVEEFQEPGVVLSSIGARCGKTFLAGSSWTTLANTQAIIPDPNQADHRYIWQVTNDESFWVRSGTAQPFIKPRDVKGAWLALPPLPEQRKIAAILSSVDEAIEKTQAVIDQVQVVKKGLMQELLTKGLPGRHQKFKQTEIGTIPESWDVREVESLADVAYGLTVNKARRESADVYPYLTVANVKNGKLDLGVVKSIGTVEGDVHRYQLCEHDIVIVEGNGNPALLGAGAMWLGGGSVMLHQNHLIRVRASSDAIVPRWLLLVINSPLAKSYFLDRSKTSSGLYTINSGVMRGLRVPVPSIDEQIRLCEVINSSDRSEERETVYLDQLRTLKSALMQTLLTGQLRVTP